jgi:hypothetical protein
MPNCRVQLIERIFRKTSRKIAAQTEISEINCKNSPHRAVGRALALYDL